MHRMLSADAERRIAPIRDEYPGLSTDDHVFILEIRTGFEHLARIMLGIESATLAAQLDAMEALARRPASPKRGTPRRRRSA